ncbi:sensor domain-containing diguanylate cyclase [Desulfarculus baarsii]|uniref:sensor domain-containing diguanylate cyclase n=1 Tax=Desulfarculus baarsii TaxID=453230 RepID=UPI0002E27B29|nr:sensor domain-containing diguanylate cyclase [Desulfarculus baarsii]
MSQKDVLHVWSARPRLSAGLHRAAEAAGLRLARLRADRAGLEEFLARGGGLLLLDEPGQQQRRELAGLLALGRAVVLEPRAEVSLTQALNVGQSFTHLLLPRRNLAAALAAALPLAQRLLENGPDICGLGQWGVDAASHLGPLLSFAAKFQVADYADEHELFESVTNFLCQRLPFERAMLFILEHDGRLMLRALSWPGGDATRLRRALADQPPALDGQTPEYELFALGRALPVSPEHNTFFPPAARAMLRGGEVALAPLYADQEMLGVIAVDHAGLSGEVMSEGELALLETAAAMVGALINNFKLFRALEGKAAELERRLRELTVLGQLTRVLNGSAGPDEMAEAMLRVVADELGATYGFIYLLDEETRRLRMISRLNLSEAMVKSWRVIRGVNPEGLEKAMDQLSSDHGRLKSLVGMPLPGYYGPTVLRAIHSRRKIVGLWGLGRENGAPEFSADDTRILAIADEQLGVAVNSLRLSHMASTDGLTGLFTRRHFVDTLEHELRVARYLHYPLSMLLLDADHFKNVNDTHGHQAGDEVLRALARVIVENIRSSDTCARIGGEEFAVLLPRCQQDQAFKLAEKIRRKVGELTVIYNEKQIKLTISLGVASFNPGDEPSIEEVIRRADLAMYQSKAAGRNRTTVWVKEPKKASGGRR